MKVPPEITYRDVHKTAALEKLIQEKLAKLERVCDHMSSCHIAIEKVQDRPRSGSPYRVRLDITVPPSHEIVAESHPTTQNQYLEVDSLIRDAFSKAERQLRELSRQQRESARVASHLEGDSTALVTRLFREQGYGFIKSLGGEDVYFHRNSVLHDDFDRLEIGTGVRFTATEGVEGLQATSVQIVDKPGASVGKSAETLIEPPLGWE